MPDAEPPHDLVVHGAGLLVTCDAAGRELPGGWVAIDDGVVRAVGSGAPPAAERSIDAGGAVVTPGLINTHHHLYQNLTRAFAPALDGELFHWLRTLYPQWARLDEEGAYVSAWIGCAELALGGCTTTADHLYLHPRGGGDLLAAEIRAAAEVGLRFHPTRGSMSLSVKDGGLPPDSVVETEDEILAACEAAVARFHDPSPQSMLRIALAPCSPFSVTPELMVATAELAERLDVRLHTHLAEDLDEDDYCLATFGRRPVELFADVGWGTDRAWVAHCIQPNDAEIRRLGAWGTGVAHCPSSNMILGAGMAPVAELEAAGSPVGLGCDGSASADSASLWTEARNAMLVGRLRHGLDRRPPDERPARFGARDALRLATTGGAAVLGRTGEIGALSPGLAADLVVWENDPILHAGALSDPVEGWLRCGPGRARTTIVAGRVVVDDGRLAHPAIEERLADHHRVADAMQAAAP